MDNKKLHTLNTNACSINIYNNDEELNRTQVKKDFTTDFWSRINVEDKLKVSWLIEGYNLFGRFLPKYGRILDVGCGVGEMVIFLRKKDYNIYGIDYVEIGLKKALAYDNSLRLSLGDICFLPYRTGSFQAYLAFSVLEYFNNPLNVLKEANRILTSDGIIIVTVPHSNLLAKFTVGRIESPLAKIKKNKFMRRLFRKDPAISQLPFCNVFSIKEIEALFEESGFKLVAIYPTNHAYNLYNLSRLFRKNELGIETKLCLQISDLLKKILPWKTCLRSLAIGRKNK